MTDTATTDEALAFELACEAAGGEAEFIRLRDWGTDNLPLETRQTFTDMIADPQRTAIAVKNLKARYHAVSEGELVVAMRDPRYKTNSGFRKQVDARRIACNK